MAVDQRAAPVLAEGRHQLAHFDVDGVEPTPPVQEETELIAVTPKGDPPVLEASWTDTTWVTFRMTSGRRPTIPHLSPRRG